MAEIIFNIFMFTMIAIPFITALSLFLQKKNIQKKFIILQQVKMRIGIFKYEKV